jgi:TPR repeat protein
MRICVWNSTIGSNAWLREISLIIPRFTYAIVARLILRSAMSVSNISLILLCVFFTACASVQARNQIHEAKFDFADGNYKKAFREMLPLASEGNADAQYAVGYMYYYGYGVTQDYESGMFWMRKAASQHNAAAVKALQMVPR